MLNGKKGHVLTTAFLVVVYLCIYILSITEVYFNRNNNNNIIMFIMVGEDDGTNPTVGATTLPNDVAARTIQTRYRNYKCVYSIYAVHARARVCVCVWMCMWVYVCVSERARLNGGGAAPELR